MSRSPCSKYGTVPYFSSKGVHINVHLNFLKKEYSKFRLTPTCCYCFLKRSWRLCVNRNRKREEMKEMDGLWESISRLWCWCSAKQILSVNKHLSYVLNWKEAFQLIHIIMFSLCLLPSIYFPLFLVPTKAVLVSDFHIKTVLTFKL